MELDSRGNTIITVVCCREWPVYHIFEGFLYDWGRCGICDTRPQPMASS